MRLGLIARADNTGLGMQTWEFFRHMSPAKTMVVDISKFNGNAQFPDRYKNGSDVIFIYGFPGVQQIDDFLQDLDIVFIAEAAYNPYLYTRAKELGIKTAVQYNYEFMDWLVNPDYPKPDMLIAPSRWHYEDVEGWCNRNGVKHVYLHCPVDREKLVFHRKHRFKLFLHVAGRSAALDRNGTETVIKAAEYIKSDARILIHFQGEQGLAHQATKSYEDYLKMVLQSPSQNIGIEKNELENYEDIYKNGDVMLLPRRYGGNCLPLNEALSTGMPVIMPDISPNNAWLPPDWLLPATKIADFTPRTHVDVYDVSPQALAQKIDEMATFDRQHVIIQSQVADALANQISWEVMKPMYEKAFEELLR